MLSGKLLSEEYHRTQHEFQKNLKTCKNGTLTLDGWTDNSNKSIYAICWIMDDSNRSCFLVDVLDLSSDRHTAAILLGRHMYSHLHDDWERIALQAF